MTDLEPCPFCGGAPTLWTADKNATRSGVFQAQIICTCGVEMKTCYGHELDRTVAIAKEFWNRREGERE